MRLITAIHWNVSQTLRGIKNNGDDFSMGVMLAGLALTIPFFVLCIWLSLSDISITVPNTEITIFTERSLSEPTVKKLERDIGTLSGVTSTQLITKEAALELVNKNLGTKDHNDANNTLPNIIIATLGTNMNPEATRQLDAEINQRFCNKKSDGTCALVVSTAYDASWAENLTRFRTAALSLAMILAVVILLLVVLVIMNSIKMTTRAQNEEIRALNTFGASSGFIAAPYGWRGAITMVFAALISIAVSWFGIGVLAEPAASLAAIYKVPLQLALPRTDYLVLYAVLCALLGYFIGRKTASGEVRRVRALQTF